MNPTEPELGMDGGADDDAPAAPRHANPLAEMLGESAPIVRLRETILRLLSRHAECRRLSPILIEGETGSGKGLLASILHRLSPRRTGPFVNINCAAIPETLLEAELFGFERGAFTDARQSKAGLFQTANHGTIFLDEVGLLTDALQAKLLKVIEERAVRRLGSTRSEPVDAWVITATNTDLAAATRGRRFREDLYHRLAVLTLRLPPVRERAADVSLLAEHFLRQLCADYDMRPKTLTADARAALLAYPWPGNVRELSNVIERVVLLSDAPHVTAEMLALPGDALLPSAPPALRRAGAGADDSAGLEPEQLLAALEKTGWNVSLSAAELGLSRNALRYRIEKYRLRPGALPLRPEAIGAPIAPPAATPPTPEPAHRAADDAGWQPRRVALLRVALGSESPEATRQLDVLIEKAESFGGRVEESDATGLVAAFGLEPVEDAPRRAVMAAIAMQKVGEREADRGVDLRLSIGVHIRPLPVRRVGGVPRIHPEARGEAWTVLAALVAGESGRILIETAKGLPVRRDHDAPESQLSSLEALVG
jgi:DNA-binding NtrC family response regulator